MVRFQFFPRSQGINAEMKQVIECFEVVGKKITSEKFQHRSNSVLEIVRPYLEEINFTVEAGKSQKDKIPSHSCSFWTKQSN